MTDIFSLLKKTGLIGGPQSLAADWLGFYRDKLQGFSDHANDVAGRMNHAITPYTEEQFSADSTKTLKLIQEFWRDAAQKNLGPLGHALWPWSEMHPDLVYAFHFKQALVLEEHFLTTVPDSHLGAALWKLHQHGGESEPSNTPDAGQSFHEHIQFQPRVVANIARVQAKNHVENHHLRIGSYSGLIYDKSSVPIHPLARIQIFVFPDPNDEDPGQGDPIAGGPGTSAANTAALPRAKAKKKAPPKKKPPAKKKAAAKKKAPAQRKAGTKKKSGRRTSRR
jgi:hypothetical protein